MSLEAEHQCVTRGKVDRDITISTLGCLGKCGAMNRWLKRRASSASSKKVPEIQLETAKQSGLAANA